MEKSLELCAAFKKNLSQLYPNNKIFRNMFHVKIKDIE